MKRSHNALEIALGGVVYLVVFLAPIWFAANGPGWAVWAVSAYILAAFGAVGFMSFRSAFRRPQRR